MQAPADFVSCCPAAADEAPAWACSPAPKSSNPLCPGSARGDARCSRRECAPDAGCAREECNAVQGNIQGTTVVLDAWLSIRGSSCKKTQWTVSECCALCQESPSCNAWSFCNNPEGCGTGCVASLHEHKASETPMHTISPVTYTRRLNPDHHCTAAGAWPYQTCSLRFVEEGAANHDSPPLMKGDCWGTTARASEQCTFNEQCIMQSHHLILFPSYQAALLSRSLLANTCCNMRTLRHKPRSSSGPCIWHYNCLPTMAASLAKDVYS